MDAADYHWPPPPFNEEESVRRAVGRNNNNNELEAQIRLSHCLCSSLLARRRVILALISSFPLFGLLRPQSTSRPPFPLFLPSRLFPESAPPRKSDAALERLLLVHCASSTVDEPSSVSRFAFLILEPPFCFFLFFLYYFLLPISLLSDLPVGVIVISVIFFRDTCSMCD